MALELLHGPGSVRSARAQVTFRSPSPAGSRAGSASFGTAPFRQLPSRRGQPASAARPASRAGRRVTSRSPQPPPEGGREEEDDRPPLLPPATCHLPPSRGSDQRPGSQSLPAPAFTCGPAPARGCQVTAPRRRPRRARKSGGFVSAAGVASGPPARAPWRAGGWGSGRVPGKSAGTGTVPKHFGPERSFCQE